MTLPTPSKGDATREYLIDLMKRLPREVADVAKEIRQDATRAQQEVGFSIASLQSAADRLEELQKSIRVLCKRVQSELMIGAVWDMTQSDDDDNSVGGGESE
jgi:signal transduction histidine kinase